MPEATAGSTLEVLGIAGSLRAGSYNRALLRAAQELAPPGMEITTFDLAPIPLYNGDVEANRTVQAFSAVLGPGELEGLIPVGHNH